MAVLQRTFSKRDFKVVCYFCTPLLRNIKYVSTPKRDLYLNGTRRLPYPCFKMATGAELSVFMLRRHYATAPTMCVCVYQRTQHDTNNVKFIATLNIN